MYRTAPRRLYSDPQMHDLRVKFWLPCLCEIIHALLTVGRAWERGPPVYIATCARVCSVSA